MSGEKEVYAMALIERWTPLRELDLMDRRMHRFFEELGVIPALAPAADVLEDEHEFVVELEVPGFDESELSIEVFDHTIAVKGKRTEESARQEKTIRLHERLESRFERRFPLPAEVDVQAAHATYQKGVLTLHVPKTSEHEPLKVPIG
jgi:HSP20 family protein